MSFDPQDKNALVTFHRQTQADGSTPIIGSDGREWQKNNLTAWSK